MEEAATDSAEERDRAKRLQTVIDAFVEYAGYIATYIIYQSNFPVEQRKIPPANAGGLAGGEKYIFRYCSVVLAV